MRCKFKVGVHRTRYIVNSVYVIDYRFTLVIVTWIINLSWESLGTSCNVHELLQTSTLQIWQSTSSESGDACTCIENSIERCGGTVARFFLASKIDFTDTGYTLERKDFVIDRMGPPTSTFFFSPTSSSTFLHLARYTRSGDHMALSESCRIGIFLQVQAYYIAHRRSAFYQVCIFLSREILREFIAVATFPILLKTHLSFIFFSMILL